MSHTACRLYRRFEVAPESLSLDDRVPSKWQRGYIGQRVYGTRTAKSDGQLDAGLQSMIYLEQHTCRNDTWY